MTEVVQMIFQQGNTSDGGRKSSTYQVLVLDYSFQEASGTQRHGRDEVRPEAHRHLVRRLLFIVMLIGSVSLYQ